MMNLPLGIFWIAVFWTAETKVFPVPPSYGDVIIWPPGHNEKFVMITLAPDGTDNVTYLFHLCGMESRDAISLVLSRQLGFNKCVFYNSHNPTSRHGIFCPNCRGSESHILQCCSSYTITKCQSVLHLPGACSGPKWPLLNGNDPAGNKGYNGEVLLFPPIHKLSLENPASVSMGLVAVKKECKDCSQWRFIRKNMRTVEMSLITTLCRQMGFTHANPGFVITLEEAKNLFHYNFSYWKPPMDSPHLTSDIRCSRSQRCLGCCSYEPWCESDGDYKIDFSSKEADDLLVIRCSFYPDESIPPSGDKKSCEFTNCKQDTSACFSFTNFDDVKLQGNSSQNDGGRLEYFKDSQWHTVCSAGFDQDEANLVCRRLGYSSAEQYGNATSLEYSTGSTGVPLLLSCNSIYSNSCSINISNCDHSEDVAIICTNHQSHGPDFYMEMIIAPGVLLIIVFILAIGIILQSLKCIRNRRQGYQNIDQQQPNVQN